MEKKWDPTHSSDAVLAASLAKLWPHRVHESNWFMHLLCRFDLHQWRELQLGHLLPERKDVKFCRWCEKVKLGGVIYPS